MTVSIESLLRVSGDRFERISAIERYRGDPRHVEGAILLSVDDVEVLSSDLWDDVNWLWPFVIQAADEARREGAGQTYFPDQPILFRVERLGRAGRLLISVRGGEVSRAVQSSAEEFYPALARAAADFFRQLNRLIPGSAAEYQSVIGVFEGWDLRH